MKASVQRVHDALLALGIEPRIREYTESARTAEDAARAIGTGVACIVKSLVFVAGDTSILALVSGTNRVSLDLLVVIMDAPVRRADAARVRASTGFAIGGVPPIGHATDLTVLLDEDLLQYDLIWAAAGTPHAVFPITPQDLVRITGAQVARLKEEEPGDQ